MMMPSTAAFCRPLPLAPVSSMTTASLSRSRCGRNISNAPRATLAERVTPPAIPAMEVSAANAVPPVPVAEPVSTIDAEEDLLAVLAQSRTALVIIRVHARWCRSCRALEPKWRRLARELAPEVYFAEMEFEANRILAARLAVKVMPTFLIYDAEQGKVDHFSCGPRRAHILRAHIEHALENKARRIRGEPTLDMPELS